MRGCAGGSWYRRGRYLRGRGTVWGDLAVRRVVGTGATVAHLAFIRTHERSARRALREVGALPLPGRTCTTSSSATTSTCASRTEPGDRAGHGAPARDLLGKTHRGPASRSTSARPSTTRWAGASTGRVVLVEFAADAPTAGSSPGAGVPGSRLGRAVLRGDRLRDSPPRWRGALRASGALPLASAPTLGWWGRRRRFVSAPRAAGRHGLRPGGSRGPTRLLASPSRAVPAARPPLADVTVPGPSGSVRSRGTGTAVVGTVPARVGRRRHVPRPTRRTGRHRRRRRGGLRRSGQRDRRGVAHVGGWRWDLAAGRPSRRRCTGCRRRPGGPAGRSPRRSSGACTLPTGVRRDAVDRHRPRRAPRARVLRRDGTGTS